MTVKTFAGFSSAVLFVGSNAISLGPAPDIARAQSSAVLNLGTVSTIDVPGATNTFALGINAEGIIVGRYLYAGRTHGFLRSPEAELTTIDVPGASFTVTTAINDRGDIVGQYALPTAPTQRHGFLLKDGRFTSFDPPGSTFTNVLGINERGDIVGRYCTLAVCGAPGTSTAIYSGFALHDGEFDVIDVPGAAETHAFKVDDRGQISGGFRTATGEEQIFLLTNGEFTAMAPPGGQSVALDNGGLNERGDIVGTYCDGGSPCLIVATGSLHGFLINGGAFTTVDVPGAVATVVFGINARGEIVGGYSDGSRFHGFLLSRWVYQPSQR